MKSLLFAGLLLIAGCVPASTPKKASPPCAPCSKEVKAKGCSCKSDHCTCVPGECKCDGKKNCDLACDCGKKK